MGKRILLFRTLLLESVYPDAKIAGELAQGVTLCGWIPASDVFLSKMRPPQLHVETLEKNERLLVSTHGGCHKNLLAIPS